MIRASLSGPTGLLLLSGYSVISWHCLIPPGYRLFIGGGLGLIVIFGNYIIISI